MRKIISVVLISMLLSGCFWNPTKPVTTNVVVENISKCGESPPITRLTMIMIRPPVRLVDADGETRVAYLPKDYENLAKNFASLYRFSKQLSNTVVYYKKCTANE